MDEKRIEFLQDMADEAREALRHIIAMLDKYPATMMPSPLLAAIVAARKIVQ